MDAFVYIWRAHGGAGKAYVAIEERRCNAFNIQNPGNNIWSRCSGALPGTNFVPGGTWLVAEAHTVGIIDSPDEHFQVNFGPAAAAADEGTPIEVVTHFDTLNLSVGA
jgi:hypothetical protein